MCVVRVCLFVCVCHWQKRHAHDAWLARTASLIFSMTSSASAPSPFSSSCCLRCSTLLLGQTPTREKEGNKHAKISWQKVALATHTHTHVHRHKFTHIHLLDTSKGVAGEVGQEGWWKEVAKEAAILDKSVCIVVQLQQLNLSSAIARQMNDKWLVRSQRHRFAKSGSTQPDSLASLPNKHAPVARGA